MCELCKLRYIIMAMNDAGEDIINALDSGSFDGAVETILSFAESAAGEYCYLVAGDIDQVGDPPDHAGAIRRIFEEKKADDVWRRDHAGFRN